MSATVTAPPRTTTLPAAVSEMPVAAGRRDVVLVVEDEDSIARLISSILARGDLRVVRARNGREGLRMLEEHEAELALATLDWKLPDIDGGVLCHQLRERASGLPVLFVSGRDVSNLKAAWAGDAKTAFVAKPFLPGEVLKQVRTLLGLTS